MKIVKFGSITTDAVGGLVFNGFDFESPDHDVEQGIEMFGYFEAAMCVVDFINEKISAIAPPVAAGSVDTDALRKLAQAASPGPWEYQEDDDGYWVYWVRTSEKVSLLCCEGYDQWTPPDYDAKFIAAANPAAILSLIERAEKAEAKLAQVNEWRAAALASNQQMQELITAKLAAAEARVKELEAALAKTYPSAIDPSDTPC